MASLAQITTAPHLIFDARATGEPSAPLVLLQHGFAASMHRRRAQAIPLQTSNTSS